MVRADVVSAYLFAGDLWHGRCLVDGMVAAGDLSPAARDMDVEEVLDQHAGALGLDRGDEQTFDSETFPKVVFECQVESTDTCGACHGPLPAGG